MGICEDWLGANHATFQVANVFLALTYIAPNTLIGLFMLRFFLSMAGLFFAIWAATVICAPDTLIWNIVFCIVNIAHVIYLLISMRPIRFNHHHEVLYKAIFEKIGVKRYQYKCLADSGKVAELKPDDVYASEQVTCATKLSIMLEGRCDIKRQGVHVSTAEPFEFVDSPEWMAGNNDKNENVYFDVSIIADVETIIVSWNKSDLLKILKKQSYLKNIMDSIIGEDISKKLFKSNKAITMSRAPVDVEQNQNEVDKILPSIVYEENDANFINIAMETLA